RIPGLRGVELDGVGHPASEDSRGAVVVEASVGGVTAELVCDLVQGIERLSAVRTRGGGTPERGLFDQVDGGFKDRPAQALAAQLAENIASSLEPSARRPDAFIDDLLARAV